MAATIDANHLMELVLRGIDPLMEVISERLFPGMLDKPPEIAASCKYLQFIGEGAAGNPDTRAGEQRFTFYCFGETQEDANAVYCELHDGIHQRGTQRVTADSQVWLWRFGEREMGPRDWPDPLTQWPRVVASYRVYYNEVPVSQDIYIFPVDPRV